MSEFVVKQLPYDLSSQAGLALIGKYLKRINLNALVVASRTMIRTLIEEVWMGSVPIFHGLHRRLALQS